MLRSFPSSLSPGTGQPSGRVRSPSGCLPSRLRGPGLGCTCTFCAAVAALCAWTYMADNEPFRVLEGLRTILFQAYANRCPSMVYYLAFTTLLEADLNWVPGRSFLAPFLGSTLGCFGGRFGLRNWSKIGIFHVLLLIAFLTLFLLLFGSVLESILGAFRSYFRSCLELKMMILYCNLQYFVSTGLLVWI